MGNVTDDLWPRSHPTTWLDVVNDQIAEGVFRPRTGTGMDWTPLPVLGLWFFYALVWLVDGKAVRVLGLLKVKAPFGFNYSLVAPDLQVEFVALPFPEPFGDESPGGWMT